MRRIGFLLLSVIGLAVAVGSLHGWTRDGGPGEDSAPGYQLAAVERSDARTVVLALGTVQPATSVVVGSQLSGQIVDVLVDHNDAVQADQPIARLDPQHFETLVAQARSDVAMAESALAMAQAAATGSAAALRRAEADRAGAEAAGRRAEVAAGIARSHFARKTRLARSGSGTETDTEDAEAAHEIALADKAAAAARLAASEAQIAEATAGAEAAAARVDHAAAELRRSHAALEQAEADLARTVIRAPAAGVVIGRSVSPGQTVAASFQAPSLFMIGDLRTVSVELVIDEADIGRVGVGQPARFTMDAYPGRVFDGAITQVRRAPHIEDTVVTYTVVLSAANEGLALFPGMTAMAEVFIDSRPGALHVPAAALGYRPAGLSRPPGSHVWVVSESGPVSVPVRVGSDVGGLVEVEGDLHEGQEVIVGDAGPAPGEAGAGMLGTLRAWVAPPPAMAGEN